MADYASSASFGQLRTQARALEGQTESLFLQYSAVAQAPGETASETETRLERELETVLEKRSEILATINRLLESQAAASSATKLHHLQRHREILVEHQKELARLRGVIVRERERASLLSTVRTDIYSYRVQSEGPTQVDARREAEYMLNERSRIDQSNSVVDGILAQAYATREEFGRQRAMLASVQQRITASASRMPGINTIITKINTRKKRDSLIIASLVSLCVLFLLFVR
ncbi:snare region anchored in the vesicle membrane C-terminus-domain-containing protein [Dipodascopsis tothii]|uniref:snare region anchored in the vesicle membrane C-terminus-domain-containing protein n=1 Tax=Dipodascopsis tothii TaxID=44089 RepID=UPI0034CE7D14